MLNLGFIILSPEYNFGRLTSTVKSIRYSYGENKCIAILPANSHAEDLKEAKTLCPAYQGGDTVTSLINKGMKHGCKEWNIIVSEGTIVKHNLHKKYENFILNEKDVLFPIIVQYNIEGYPVKIYKDFTNCTLNGLMLHAKTFKKVGPFEDFDLETSKTMWAGDGLAYGCQFKAIFGIRLL